MLAMDADDGPHANPVPPRNAVWRTMYLTLRVPDMFGASRVAVAGDFTAWTPVDLARDADGLFVGRFVVPAGRRWRYRLCLDGDAWVNDPGADEYELDEHNAGVSVCLS